ncbi:MAG TPA: hypothetical protein PK037_08290 [Saprospiraceae bacterium]|nr:hypothetical protein [Saprospiraceae bacterium]
MLRKIVILIPMLLICFISRAQYNYSQFRYADVDVKGLSVNPEAYAGHRNYNSSFDSKDDLLGLFINGSANYFRFVNFQDVQARTSFNNYLQLNGYVDGNDLTYNQFTVQSLYSTSKTRFKQDQHFRETKLVVSSNESRQTVHNRLNPEQNTINWFISPQASFEYNFGKGRIEPIGPVFLARFIVEDLKNEARQKDGTTLEDQFMMGTSKEWSQEELFELGRLIATQQNRRVFDFRVRIKDQIRKVVEYIANKKQLDPLDVYGIVADNWQFAYQFNRSCGSRAYWGVAPMATFSAFNKNRDYSTTLSLHRGWRKEVPVSYNRQKSIEARIGAGVSHYINDILSYNHFYLYTSFLYEVGYFPTSRTYAGLTFSFDGEARYRDETEDIGYNIYSAINFRASYFLSYNTRLNLGGRFLRRFFKIYDYRQDDLNLVLTAGLVHNFY